jgi:cytochrome c oxidase subunit II
MSRPTSTPCADVAPGARGLILLAGGLALGACQGPQSAFAPAGVEAERVLALWWTMAAGAALIYLLVLGAAVYAALVAPERHPRFPGIRFIIGGGVALPVVVLAALLSYSFVLARDFTRALPQGALRIEVVGKQWWWEVRYLVPGGAAPVVAANELRLPAGEPVELLLSASDVIHSFWLPSIAGKRDMIPGQVNRLVLDPKEPGVYRGQCAEYCGGPHALMAFHAIVQEPAAFAAWLEAEAAPVARPADPFLAKGHDLFLASGCGACHTVRGTPAAGDLGPDLTHVGARLSLAAGALPNNVGTIAGWIADSQSLKPDNHMPSFNTFTGVELRALAAWLASLE